MDRSELLNIAILAAKQSGDIIKKGFFEKGKVESKKGKHNLVTEYDYASEKAIIEMIKEHFPDHSFLAEESGETNPSKESIQWIIDPLDGTVNFAHRIPVFAVSIAAYYQAKPLCGAIYQPMTDELFTAEKNKGAFINGKKMEVSKTPNLDKSILATGFPYVWKKNPDHYREKLMHFLKVGMPLRRLGAAAIDLAYVADGRLDGFWETRLNAWDTAAGILLIKEAGGEISTWEGSPYDVYKSHTIVASNKTIHQEMISIIGK